MSTLRVIPYEGPGELLFSDDPERFDMEFLLPNIRETYFGKDRTPSVMLKMIQNSLNFSLFYRHPQRPAFVDQIAYARVVTDRVGFGWVADVVVDSGMRRRGFGKALMNAIIEHPSLAGVTLNLGTRDAAAFYAQFGFQQAGHMMRRPQP